MVKNVMKQCLLLSNGAGAKCLAVPGFWSKSQSHATEAANKSVLETIVESVAAFSKLHPVRELQRVYVSVHKKLLTVRFH